jgi:hypothetical protein
VGTEQDLLWGAAELQALVEQLMRTTMRRFQQGHRHRHHHHHRHRHHNHHHHHQTSLKVYD